MKKTTFLNHLVNLAKNQTIYHNHTEDNGNHFFYFYQDGLQFSISGKDSYISIEIFQDQYNKSHVTSFGFTLNESKTLLETMVSKFKKQKEEENYLLTEHNIENIHTSIQLVTEEFKKTTLTQKLTDLLGDDFWEMRFSFKENNRAHELLVGRLTGLKKINPITTSTSLLQIPLILEYHNEKNVKSNIKVDLFVPGFEINSYPVLKSITNNNFLKSNDQEFDLFIKNITDNFPSGKNLFTELLKEELDSTLPEAKNSSSKNKL